MHKFPHHTPEITSLHPASKYHPRPMTPYSLLQLWGIMDEAEHQGEKKIGDISKFCPLKYKLQMRQERQTFHLMYVQEQLQGVSVSVRSCPTVPVCLYGQSWKIPKLSDLLTAGHNCFPVLCSQWLCSVSPCHELKYMERHKKSDSENLSQSSR